MNVKISDLPRNENPSKECVILTVENRTSQTITLGQLIGLQQAKLNKPCHYCGSRGKYDTRGNCGACGAPQEAE